MGNHTSRLGRLPANASRRFPHPGLVLILAVFLILATCYSLIVPLAQGEDELAHYRYLKFIAQTGRLPANEAEREQAWYRADWPPLYHLLVGWAVSPLNTTQPRLKDIGESPHRRLVGEIYYPRLIVYTEDFNWPWQDGILAWHLGRFISIFFAAGALIFTYFTALEMCRDTKEPCLEFPCSPFTRLRSSSAPLLTLAVSATALLAFMPRYLFTSAMLSDDSLFILLSAIFIWLLLRALRGDDRWRVYVVMGLLLGLSLATKYSTILLPLALIPVVWWRTRQVGWRWRQGLGRIAIAWTAALTGVSWWFGWIGYYFNTIEEDGPVFGVLGALLNTGPDVSMRRIFALFTGNSFTGLERPEAIQAGTFWDWLVYLFETFWGVPVLEYDPLFPGAYLLVLAFGVMALIGLWRLWRVAGSETRITLGVLALIVMLLLPSPVLRFFLTHNVLETGQGRHILYPAAQAIPLLLMLGWGMICARGQGPGVGGREPGARYALLSQVIRYILYTLPVLLLLVWSIFLLIYMSVTYPAPLPIQTTTFEPGSVPRSLEHSFGDDVQLLGYDVALDQEQGRLRLTLFWQSIHPAPENYRTQIQLVDGKGQTHLTWLSHPLNARYPTRAWDQADVVRDELELPLIGLRPNRYTVQLNLLHEADDNSLNKTPLALTEFDLPTAQPLLSPLTVGDIAYRLWVDGRPLRYRQTLALSWIEAGGPNPESQPAWTLIGPDHLPRSPRATGDGTAIFMVGADWPSGDYRLELQQNGMNQTTGSMVTVANQARLFALEPVPEGFIPVEASFANATGQPQVKLLGYTLPTRRVQPGGSLPLTLCWQGLAPVLADTLTFVVLLDANLQPYGSIDRYPLGFYSPILWAEGEVVVDDFSMPVQAEAPPGVYTVHLGQYHLQHGQPEYLTLLRQDQPGGETAVVIGPIKVGGPPPGVTTENPTPQVTLNQPFGGKITLLGYDLNLESRQLNLTLYWRADANLQTDYTTFLHLRDTTNRTVAQKDSPPAGGRYPTSLWEIGEIVIDEITLTLDQMPPGQYTPVVGLYEFATGARLPVSGIPTNEMALELLELKE
ncbi:MAG: glycosyltransferase family 39 protein [Anaerolineae bacterium]|nr:glycosyltransferase family 39 protein [Anaerolineae bacterium]